MGLQVESDPKNPADLASVVEERSFHSLKSPQMPCLVMSVAWAGYSCLIKNYRPATTETEHKQAGLELRDHLPLSPKCWDSQCVQPPPGRALNFSSLCLSLLDSWNCQSLPPEAKEVMFLFLPLSQLHQQSRIRWL